MVGLLSFLIDEIAFVSGVTGAGWAGAAASIATRTTTAGLTLLHAAVHRHGDPPLALLLERRLRQRQYRVDQEELFRRYVFRVL
jgi:hypothetical protein